MFIHEDLFCAECHHLVLLWIELLQYVTYKPCIIVLPSGGQAGVMSSWSMRNTHTPGRPSLGSRPPRSVRIIKTRTERGRPGTEAKVGPHCWWLEGVLLDPFPNKEYPRNM